MESKSGIYICRWFLSGILHRAYGNYASNFQIAFAFQPHHYTWISQLDVSDSMLPHGQATFLTLAPGGHQVSRGEWGMPATLTSELFFGSISRSMMAHTS